MTGKNILLTGAGFTHNFGTPLAEGMWSAIFNDIHIQAEPKLKIKMQADCDYESIYNSVMDGSYTEKEKEAFNETIYSAYENIDSIIIDYGTSGGKNAIILHAIREFIRQFSKEIETNFFFTLNQDLFIERFYFPNYNEGWIKPAIPGIDNKPDWFSAKFSKHLEISDYCQVSDKIELSDNPDSLSENFYYVKLHGSCNWISSNGKRQMVIGRGKVGQIHNEPLLKYYSELFRNVLFQPERRLFVIGYGFGDRHINEIIADAVKVYRLKIYIISPNSPKNFWNELNRKHFGDDIWQGLSGFYPYKLTDIIPKVGLYGYQFKNICKNYFGEEGYDKFLDDL